MNVDKFGHHINKRQKICDKFQAECVFKRTDNGLSAQNKTLKNIGVPTDDNDSATKQYVDNAVDSYHKTLKILKELLTELTARVIQLEKFAESNRQGKNEQSRRCK